MIRKAEIKDLDAVDCLYRKIHDAEEAGLITTSCGDRGRFCVSFG